MFVLAVFENRPFDENRQSFFDRYARFLQLNLSKHSVSLPSGWNFHFFWLHRHPLDKNLYYSSKQSRIVFSSTHSLPSLESESSVNPLDILLQRILNPVFSLLPHENRIMAGVPLTSPEKLYYTETENGLLLSNDLRWLALWRKAEFSKKGLTELLHLRVNPLSRTIFQNIFRIPNGHTLDYCPEKKIAVRTSFLISEYLEKPVIETASVDIESLIRQSLHQPSEHTGILFSGGVDSSLMAALQPATDQGIPLIHYSFSPDDPNTALAREVAGSLNKNLHIISHDREMADNILNEIFFLYTHPFGDHAFLASAWMIRSVARSMPQIRYLADGDGADSLFGGCLRYHQNKAFYKHPKWLAHAGSRLYSFLKLWRFHKKESFLGYLENTLLNLVLRLQFPHELSWMFPKKTLKTIAYSVPESFYDCMMEDLSLHYRQTLLGLPEEEIFALALLIQNVCGISTAKTYDVLQISGLIPVFPFLQNDLIRKVIPLPCAVKNPHHEPKGLLKKILEHDLPPHLIYRPKKGFIPPSREILKQKTVQDRFEEVVFHPDNELIPFCHDAVIREALKRIRQGHSVSKAMFGFLWLLLFSSLWIHQYKTTAKTFHLN